MALALCGWLGFGLGAFEPRPDGMIEVQLGEEMDAGNLVFSFERATVQQILISYSDPEWELVVTGTVRNPHDQVLKPMDGDQGNFIAALDGQTMLRPRDLRPFAIAGAEYRPFVLPDDQPVAFAVRFELDDDFVAPDDPHVNLGVFPMEYTDNRVYGLGLGSKRWNLDSSAPFFGLQLPVEVLPPTTR